MKTNKPVNNFPRKYGWESALLILSVAGIAWGVVGFAKMNKNFPDGLYETLRLFLLNVQFETNNIPWQIEIARWLLFAVFILFTFKLFITIVAPLFFQYLQIRRYKNHIVICGLNAIAMELIRRLGETKIVVIAAENNQYTESLKQRNIKLIVGDPIDNTIFKRANIAKASQLFAVTVNDMKNVEIAQSAFTWLQTNFRNRPEPLQCYTLIYDRELKNLLEETALFKYTVKESEQFYFDGILFNMNETGIKYSIRTNIDKILLQKPENTPEFLLVGLTDKTENIILNLAHGLTMNRESFRFTIMESNKETISGFKFKYAYLQDFAEIKYAESIHEACENKRFAAVFVCAENQIESIKTTIAVRNIIAENQPNIFAFSEESEHLNEVFNAEGCKILPLKDRNIFLINTLEETIEYIVTLNPMIEMLAEMTHNRWRKKDESGNYAEKDEYGTISGHFKQTNRNQVLDNYLRTFIATGKPLNSRSKSSLAALSDKDKETLARMEHRRWMIEKYNNGWRYGKMRKDHFKIHTDLCSWENLSENDKQKDHVAIDLMITGLS